MNNREQFEVWYLDAWGCTEDNLDSLFEESPHGNEYYRFGVRLAWQAWQQATKQSEAKCAALAADNDKAMEAMRQADEVVKRAHSKFAALADENMALRSALENGMAAPETPATDAFLAEVLAQGVDMFGQYHNFSEKLFIQKEAKKFAAQLRQEAAL